MTYGSEFAVLKESRTLWTLFRDVVTYVSVANDAEAFDEASEAVSEAPWARR